MEGHCYSGYLADDEGLQGAQRDKFSNKPTVTQARNTYDWKALLRAASPCGCQNPTVSSDVLSFRAFQSDKGEKKGNQDDPVSSFHGAAQEFSNFVDFLVNMDALDSLQQIMEEAIHKIREVMVEDEEGLLDFKEDVSSRPESESWAFSCGKQCDCFSSYHYPSTSSSEEECTECLRSKAGHRLSGKSKLQDQCMLDKFVAQIPKKEMRRRTEEVAGIFHTKSVTEKSSDYYFRQEHFHIWAQLAESSVGLHEQRAASDFFSKTKKKDRSQLEGDSSFDIKHIEKEITNVLKQPTPSATALYYPDEELFKTLDFLEENKLFSALQDIVNQAILEILDATKKDGSPLFSMGDYSGITGDSQPLPGNIDKSTQTISENAKEEEESTKEGKEPMSETRESTEKSKHHKSKPKSPVEKLPSKPKYVPPPLPKSKPRAPSEPPPPKPKYVPPPLPKSKPRPPVEKPPPKPKYVPPPLSKPKPKKAAIVEEELQFSQIFYKDQSGGRMKGKLYRRQEEIVDFLVENAAKHVLYKYNYEKSLSEKLGFISVPVTKVLLEIMFGFKKLKGSSIRLSSQIDWAEVYQQVHAKRPAKPKKPGLKSGDKKITYSKPKIITGKVKLIKKPTEQITSLPKITEIVPLKFPDDFPQSREDSQGQDSVESLRQRSSSSKSIIPADSQKKLSVVLLDTEGQNSTESPRQSLSSRRASITSESNIKSPTVLPDTEVQNSVEHLWEASSSRRASITRESSRKSSTVLLESEGQNSVETVWQASSSRRTSITEGSNRKSSTILSDAAGQNSVESPKQSSLSQRTNIMGESSQKSSTVLPKI